MNRLIEEEMERQEALIELKRKDSVVETVLEMYMKRSNEGLEKYGTTLDRDDLSVLDWLIHLQEELMDATLYIEKLKSVFK